MVEGGGKERERERKKDRRFFGACFISIGRRENGNFLCSFSIPFRRGNWIIIIIIVILFLLLVTWNYFKENLVFKSLKRRNFSVFLYVGIRRVEKYRDKFRVNIYIHGFLFAKYCTGY